MNGGRGADDTRPLSQDLFRSRPKWRLFDGGPGAPPRSAVDDFALAVLREFLLGTARIDAIHQRIHHFITCSHCDRAVRVVSARHCLSARSRCGLDVDDTGILEQGANQ